MKFSRHTEGLALKPGETIDAFLDGKLHIIQSISGYRFSIDSVFLADFVMVKKDDVVVELGTGCGIVLLMLIMKSSLSKAIGLEVQEELASQALRNCALNRAEGKMYVVVGDLRACPIAAGCADLVVCNPPYRKAKSGRINPERQKAIARHEIMASLEDVLKAARQVLKPKGRIALIYTAEQLAHVIAQMRKYQLEPKRIQVQYPSLQSRAKLILVEGVLGGRPGLHIEPPIVGQGQYSIP